MTVPDDPNNVNAFFVAGGTLQQNAACYVTRKADTALFDAILRGEFCYVLTSRQMGKSSLMVRTTIRLREQGLHVAVLDLTSIGLNLTPEQWYDGLLLSLGQQFDLEDELEDFWRTNQRTSPMSRFFTALREVLLPNLPGKMVLFVDEVDAVRSLSFSADEFFAGIRECWNRRADTPGMERLTFGLFGVASPSDLIKDTRVTPFNIGTRIELTDFTAEEARPLAAGLNQNNHDGQKLLARILHWTNGHPYLTLRLCRALTEDAIQNQDVDSLVDELFFSAKARESDDNLIFVRERLLRSELDKAGLLTLYRDIREGKRIAYDEADPFVTVLRLSGITRVRQGVLNVRNRIYYRVFDKDWIESAMPEGELRRLRAAYRKGVRRTIALASVVVALVGGFAAFAFYQKSLSDRNAELANNKTIEANERADYAEHLGYIANMNLIAGSYEKNAFGRVKELLNETRKSRFRGFEWGYWNRLCHLDLMTLKGHTKDVNAVAYSPDGKHIVTGSDDKTAKVWDANTGQEVLTLKGHTNFVTSVAFSPDGKRIVTGSEDKTAKVWDAETGRETLTLRGHTTFVTSVAFSLDSKHIVTGSEDKTAKIWDAKTGHEALTLKGHTTFVGSVAFSPNGKHIVTGSWDGTAKVWDSKTGREIFTLKGHTFGVHSVAFSPDGKRIVTGSEDNTAKVWDANTGRETLTLKGHTYRVHSVAFSPNGKHIVTGSEDSTTKIWDVNTGQENLTLKGHNLGSRSIAFSPDGKRIIAGNADSTAKVWNANTGQEIFTLKGHTGFLISVAFSHDGKRLATTSLDKTAKVWEAQTGQEILTLKGHTGYVWSVAFSPDDKHIVTASNDKTVKVWDATTGKEILPLKGHTREVYSVAFSPDGKHIATGSVDGTAKVWDAETGRETLVLKRHAGMVFSVAFSPDNKSIVTGQRDNTVTIWNAHTGQVILTLKGHTKSVRSAVFSPDGKRIVTGSDDKTAKVWDAETGRETLTLKGHTDTVFSVTFSPDGRRIVTGGFDGTVKVWTSDDRDFEKVIEK